MCVCETANKSSEGLSALDQQRIVDAAAPEGRGWLTNCVGLLASSEVAHLDLQVQSSVDGREIVAQWREPSGCFALIVTYMFTDGRLRAQQLVRLQGIVRGLQMKGVDNVIVTGDWNVVVDPELDVQHGSGANDGHAELRLLMTSTKLVDVYELQQRPRLPNDFTWTPAGRLKEGQVVKRLDYFLITCRVSIAATRP